MSQSKKRKTETTTATANNQSKEDEPKRYEINAKRYNPKQDFKFLDDFSHSSAAKDSN